MRSLHSDFPAFIWLQLTPYDTHCCFSDWIFQGMALTLIAGTWCIFCVQCECNTGSHVALLRFWESLVACRLSFSFLTLSEAVSSWLPALFRWVSPFPHGVPLLPSSSSWSSSMSSASQAAFSFCSGPSLKCCLAVEWMLMGRTEALCVYLCWGQWHGPSDKNKACYVWEFPREAVCFVLYFAV